MKYVMSTNVNNTNQVNDVVENELKFDSSNSLSNNTVKYPLPIVSISLIEVVIIDIPLVQV